MKINRELSILAAVVVCFIWGMFFMFTLGIQFCGEGEKFSKMGDAFNMLNALFAGLAFTAICFQLWMQQTQIDEERADRRRAERISALTTSIQVTFDKIVFERELLLQVAPSFAKISFLHDGDGQKTEESINAKEGYVKSLGELIEQIQQRALPGGMMFRLDENLKELWDNQAALTMLKHI